MEQSAWECRCASRPRDRVAGQTDAGRIGAAPLAGLAGSPLEPRFRYWRGASGRRYLFSVFPAPGSCGGDAVPRFENAVSLAVARGAGDARVILAVVETGSLPDAPDGADALACGADEIHVHLLATSATERAAIRRDLLG